MKIALLLVCLFFAFTYSAPVNCQQKQSITLEVGSTDSVDDCSSLDGCAISCADVLPNCNQWNETNMFYKFDLPRETPEMRTAYETVCEKRQFSYLSPYWIKKLTKKVKIYCELLDISGPALSGMLGLFENIFRAWRSYGLPNANLQARVRSMEQWTNQELPRRKRDYLMSLRNIETGFYRARKDRQAYVKDFTNTFRTKFEYAYESVREDYFDIVFNNKGRSGRFNLPYYDLTRYILNRMGNPERNSSIPTTFFGVSTLKVLDNMGLAIAQFSRICERQQQTANSNLLLEYLKKRRQTDPTFPFGPKSTFSENKVGSAEWKEFEKQFVLIPGKRVIGDARSSSRGSCECMSFNNYLDYLKRKDQQQYAAAMQQFNAKMIILKAKCQSICKTQPKIEEFKLFD